MNVNNAKWLNVYLANIKWGYAQNSGDITDRSRVLKPILRHTSWWGDPLRMFGIVKGESTPTNSCEGELSIPVESQLYATIKVYGVPPLNLHH